MAEEPKADPAVSSGLKNCPFCGAEPHIANYIVEAAVRCPGCQVVLTRPHLPAEDNGYPDVIAAWNTRAPSDAALVEALEEAEATLALCEHPRSEDRSYGPEVDELGRRIGFGALMSSAQASWRKYLHDKGNPLGGEFVAGPTFGTVTRTLGIIRSALAAAKGQP